MRLLALILGFPAITAFFLGPKMSPKEFGVFYPVEFFNTLTYSIYITTGLGWIIVASIWKLFAVPEFTHNFIERTVFRSGVEVNITDHITIKNELTKDEQEKNQFYFNFLSLSFIPLGIYYLLVESNVIVNFSPFSSLGYYDRYLYFKYLKYYVLIPIGICIIFSIILFFTIKRLNIKFEIIKKRIATIKSVLWKIGKYNIVCMTLYFWLIKLNFLDIIMFFALKYWHEATL
jgi:hypothetical protein